MYTKVDESPADRQAPHARLNLAPPPSPSVAAVGPNASRLAVGGPNTLKPAYAPNGLPAVEALALSSLLTARRSPSPPPDRLHAGAVAPAALDKNTDKVSTRRTERREGRYKLRGHLRLVTDNVRLLKCGRCRISPDVSVKVQGGAAHYSGLATCGLVWLCPVCSATISARRATEVQGILAAHALAGGGAEFLTLTLRHDKGDRLLTLRKLVARAWKRTISGRAWLELKSTLGVTGTIRAVEVTSGQRGWHVHAHVLLLFDRPLQDIQRNAVWRHCYVAWRRESVKTGHQPLPENVTLLPVRNAADVGRYVTKLGTALELTHGAIKSGRRAESRTPFQVLQDFTETGDDADLQVWLEWERGMRGAKQLTYSRGLKARYAVAEVTDEALAAETVGGEVVALLTAATWKQIVALGLECAVLNAAERGGGGAVDALLSALHRPPLPSDGQVTPRC